jgi:predicted nucleic acid-binding protein
LRIDLARSLRRIKPERFSGSLPRRDDVDLGFVDAAPSLGAPLLLDTCVYIDDLEGSLPLRVETLLRTRTLMHLSVVLGELSHNFGRLDPGHPNTREHLDELAGMIGDIPRHRLDDAVSGGVILEAGILSGLVFRLGGFQPGQEVAALNDATIYLHALECGYTVLTRNIRDFDFMSQIVPPGRVLFYRAT